MINIYKPTAKNNGHACQLWYSTNENAFFLEILKQHSWNAGTRSGTFKASKDNQKKRAVVKFSLTEMCGILNAIDNNSKFSGYHDAPNSKFKTQISFGPYVNAAKEVLGYSLQVTKTDKEDSTVTGKSSFVLGFTFPELNKTTHEDSQKETDKPEGGPPPVF